jgi:hypothetical protein
MWIMTDTGFVSIVQFRDDPSKLLVRARVEDDLYNVFGEDITVETLPGADYLYRTVLDRVDVAEILTMKVFDLDYESHAKDVALDRSAKVPGRTEAYYGTWSAMAKMQPIPPYQTQPTLSRMTPCEMAAAPTLFFDPEDDAVLSRTPAKKRKGKGKRVKKR